MKEKVQKSNRKQQRKNVTPKTTNDNEKQQPLKVSSKKENNTSKQASMGEKDSECKAV